MLAQHFFQVHFALTSKDISAFFDRWSNQQSENKARNLSARFTELLQFTNMLLIEKNVSLWQSLSSIFAIFQHIFLLPPTTVP